MRKYEPVIGLEVHIELATTSKMFCSCPADHFAKEPNSQVCPVCLGLPGALPVPNKKAIRWAQLLGASLKCKLETASHFDRKHYFYPDLPKGYQISQYDEPLCRDGQWAISSGKKVRIKRVHLEEDTGKLIHQKIKGEKVTMVDFNRSGVPLVEVVTEPDFASIKEVREFVRGLQQLVRYLAVSGADMEKGSMRLEVNISLKKKDGSKVPDYRVELKNINSFRFMEAALSFEIERQEKALLRGQKLIQETRGYDEKSRTTRPQRWKEEEQDYRYFPEPDIPPFSFAKSDLEEVRNSLPELPEEKRMRFLKQYNIPQQYVSLVSVSPTTSEYFEKAARIGKRYDISATKIASTIVNKKPDQEKISPAKLVKILREEQEKPVLPNEELDRVVLQSIKQNPKAVEDYKKGKETAIQFLVGQVMTATKGQADPKQAAEKISAQLKAE